jgi:hypothetical protein
MSRPKEYKQDRELLEDRKWTCEIYPDSESYDCEEILARLKYYWTDDAEWYYAFHDLDTYTEDDLIKFQVRNGQKPEWKVGDKKKPHYHLVVRNGGPIVLGNAAKKFGIPSNHVDRVKDFKRMVRYLIHKDNTEKFQYTEDIIINNNPDKLKKYLKDDMDVTEKATMLLDYIFGEKCTCLTDLAQFAIRNNCWDELRRGQHIYTTLIIERNQKND